MRFNSQPPEGGWFNILSINYIGFCFNSQPPEGGWTPPAESCLPVEEVSTHSRPKAAGPSSGSSGRSTRVSTHSRPKAAGLTFCFSFSMFIVSTHSRPKAAGADTDLSEMVEGFQLTAARRRLVNLNRYQ